MGQPKASTGSRDGDFLSQLPQEIGRWERDGIITSEQGRAILAHISHMAEYPSE